MIALLSSALQSWCYAAYKKLEECKQQPKDQVFEFKVWLEEHFFWMLEDEPSELAKTTNFMTSLPALKRKLHGKEYVLPFSLQSRLR